MPRKDRESRLAYDRERRSSPEARAAAAERSRLWRLKHPEQAKAGCANWRKNNPELAKLANSAWRLANPELAKEYKRKNKKRANELRRKRQQANPWATKMSYVRRLLRRAGCSELEVQRGVRAWGCFNGLCHACGKACDTQFDTDHDHVALTFRGILGSSCNKALGMIKDNPERLRLLADYLEAQNGRS